MPREIKITLGDDDRLLALAVKVGEKWIEAELDRDAVLPTKGGEILRLVSARGADCPEVSGMCWRIIGGICVYRPCP